MGDETKIQNLQDAFEPATFKEGETIITQGEEGDRFYLIISGKCKWTKKSDSGEVETGDLCLNDYFGERALITKEKRAATIVSTTKVKTLALSKEDFTEIIGEGKIFRKRMTSYDSRAVESPKADDQPTVCSLVDPLNDKSYALK